MDGPDGEGGRYGVATRSLRHASGAAHRGRRAADRALSTTPVPYAARLSTTPDQIVAFVEAHQREAIDVEYLLTWLALRTDRGRSPGRRASARALRFVCEHWLSAEERVLLMLWLRRRVSVTQIHQGREPGFISATRGAGRGLSVFTCPSCRYQWSAEASLPDWLVREGPEWSAAFRGRLSSVSRPPDDASMIYVAPAPAFTSSAARLAFVLEEVPSPEVETVWPLLATGRQRGCQRCRRRSRAFTPRLLGRREASRNGVSPAGAVGRAGRGPGSQRDGEVRRLLGSEDLPEDTYTHVFLARTRRAPRSWCTGSASELRKVPIWVLAVLRPEPNGAFRGAGSRS